VKTSSQPPTAPIAPSAIVIPFGRHKGATVAELLEKDPAYAEWIIAQGWVAERFAELHAAILSRGAGTDDSPEHNLIQAKFLDPVFRVACVSAAYPGLIADGKNERVKWAGEQALKSVWKGNAWYHVDGWRVTNTKFATMTEAIAAEQIIKDAENASDKINGKKARIEAENTEKATGVLSRVVFEQKGIDAVIQFENIFYYDRIFSVEIKPSMGDDYPTVMRQAQRLGCSILVVGEYTGRAVPEPLVRQMFAASGIKMISLRDIEAEIPNARGYVT